MLLQGPARVIAIEATQFNSDPHQFEYLTLNQDAPITTLDEHFSSAQLQLLAPGVALLADIDDTAGGTSGILAIAEDIGAIPESGLLDDLSAIGETIDPDVLRFPII